MDHNSMIYYKHFWDVTAPIVFNLGLNASHSAEARFNFVLDSLKLDLVGATPYQLSRLIDFEISGSPHSYSNSSFFHVIEDKL
jgi:hypothetical protein